MSTSPALGEARRELPCEAPPSGAKQGCPEIAAHAPCDIFIRTYQGDFPWLRYCLASIRRHASGFRRTVLVMPDSSRETWLKSGIPTEGIDVHYCEEFADDYMGQQLTKLEAWTFTDAPLLMYLDSDCVLREPFSPQSLIRDGRIFLLITSFRSMGNSQAICWKELTEAILGGVCEYETMRRIPLLYPARIVKRTHELAGGADGLRKRLNTRLFSEFNLMGTVALREFRDEFSLLDTDKEPWPPCPAEQFYSRHPFTPEILDRIKGYLGGTLP